MNNRITILILALCLISTNTSGYKSVFVDNSYDGKNSTSINSSIDSKKLEALEDKYNLDISKKSSSKYIIGDFGYSLKVQNLFALGLAALFFINFI